MSGQVFPEKRHRDDDRDDKERRDQLDKRIRQRDAEATRKLASRKDWRQDEIAKRLSTKPISDVMRDKRQESRRAYLDSRVAKQIRIHEESLIDEKILFSNSVLTKKEREKLAHDQRILDITKSTVKASEEAKKIKQYVLPDSQGIDQMQVDEEDEDQGNERKSWEESKIRRANLKLDLQHSQVDYSDMSRFDLLLQDKEFCHRVKRGDTFESEIIDDRKRLKEERERARRLMDEQRKKLPVYKRKDELLQAIDENQIVIVQGATGCGKTTQMPQYLHEAGYTKTEFKDDEVKMIGCTQPRRVAAMSVAARVSSEIGCKLGHAVGYSVRFEDCTSEGTVIKYMTDGMLLREMLVDATLSKYSVMIVDEAHERTLHTDILLTMLKDVTRHRRDFKLIISSATLDEQKFWDFFNQPPVFKIEGRLHRVEKEYLKKEQKDPIGNITDACLRAVARVHKEGEPGDILVFLPGQDDIDELQEQFEKSKQVQKLISNHGPLWTLPIYANLPTDQQAEVFKPTPHGVRKVVIATNIAETSITIDGIRFVIDSGFCKQNRFSSKTGMETLAVTRISKASADQRAGRAGRTAPGRCYRLYTQEEFNDFDENTQPEIQRLNLANVVLLLKSMSENIDVVKFEYVDRPPTEALLYAIEQLTSLGALNAKGDLTPLGRKMSEFPVDPKMSKSIVASASYKCSEEVLTIMSMLGVNGTIFYRRKNKDEADKDKSNLAETGHRKFMDESGDHLTLFNVYDEWATNEFKESWCRDNHIQYKTMCRARDIRDQLELLCERVEVELLSNKDDMVKIRQAILTGFFTNVARVSREAGSYRTVRHSQSVYIHKESSLRNALPRWLVYNEIRETSKAFMRTISEIEPSWLMDVAPTFYSPEQIEELTKKRMPKINRGKSRAELNPRYGR